MSWSVHDSVEATKRGMAAITVVAKAFVTQGRAQGKALSFPELPIAQVPYPFGILKREEISRVAQQCADDIAGLLCDSKGAEAAGAGSSAPVVRAAKVEAPAAPADLNRFFVERKWSDGLPVIPPTPEAVSNMLRYTHRAPGDVVAAVAPAYGAATVEYIAINAVLAGCYPEYLPVLIAATEAIAVPSFNLPVVQAATNTAAVWLIVNGPIAKRLGINSGANCLGPGNWANATLGRAMRLIQHNIGGALPGEIDRSTHGQPAKYSFCCAENEEASPWEPLHVERGFKREQSTVTVVAALGTWNMNTHAQDADDVLKVIAGTMPYPASSDYVWAGEPWLLLGQEHANIFHRAGMSKLDVKRRLWEQSKLPANWLSAKDFAVVQNARREELGEFGRDAMLPVSLKPEHISILVAGGVGTHSIYVPNSGLSRSVTREIVWTDDGKAPRN